MMGPWTPDMCMLITQGREEPRACPSTKVSTQNSRGDSFFKLAEAAAGPAPETMTGISDKLIFCSFILGIIDNTPTGMIHCVNNADNTNICNNIDNNNYNNNSNNNNNYMNMNKNEL